MYNLYLVQYTLYFVIPFQCFKMLNPLILVSQPFLKALRQSGHVLELLFLNHLQRHSEWKTFLHVEHFIFGNAAVPICSTE